MPNERSIWSRILTRINLGEIFRVPPPPLIDRGLGLIYDTERDFAWLQDLNYAETSGRSSDDQLTWPEAMRWVASLSYRGIHGWRLPRAGATAAESELGHIFLEIFRDHPGIVTLKNGKVPCIFCTSAEASTEKALAFDLFSLRQGELWKDPFVERFAEPPLSGPVYSWAVHDGDVAAAINASWLGRAVSWVVSISGRQN